MSFTSNFKQPLHFQTSLHYKMSCIECGQEPKYKCPTCRQPYCSMLCCKKHKETPCTAPPTVEVPQDLQVPRRSTEYDFPTDDTIPLEKLQLLGQSAELRKCLENPHVRQLLENLDRSPHPDELIQEYMVEPIFTEFVDACLSVVQPRENNEVK